MSVLASAGDSAVDLIHRAGVVLILAQPGDPDPSNGKGPEWGKAAPIGLLIIALLCVALFFLVKSMNKQFKKVPASFGPAPDESLDGGAAARGGTGARAAELPADGGNPGAARSASGPPSAKARTRRSSGTDGSHPSGSTR